MGKIKYSTMLKQLIAESQYPVFLGGAGVLTSCGMPDFRNFSRENILSYSYFKKNPAIFYEFYRKYFNFLDCKPNIIHRKLAMYKIPVITQNIDNLHEKAGSTNVIHINGSMYSPYCEVCLNQYNAKDIFNKDLWDYDGVPRCKCSGAVIKPGILLYGERQADTKPMKMAKAEIKKADLLIIGGAFLAEYPARELVELFSGKKR